FCFFRYAPSSRFYPLPLHDALPISVAFVADVGLAVEAVLVGVGLVAERGAVVVPAGAVVPLLLGGLAVGFEAVFAGPPLDADRVDRKSTRLNSSHVKISYAVFCLKK